MTYWDDDDDDWDDDDDQASDGDEADTLSPAERPDPADLDGPDDDDAVPCPFCGRAVYESADVCPGCGSFLGGADEPRPRRPWWVTVGFVLCVLGILAACAHEMW